MHNNDAVCGGQLGESRRQPVQARDTDVLLHRYRGAQELRPDPRLVQDASVGGSRRDHRHPPSGLGQRARDPDAAGALILVCIRFGCPHRGPRGGVGPGDEHAAGSALEQRAHDRGHLVGALALPEHGLGGLLAHLPVEVHAGEPEIAEGQRREALEGSPRLDVSPAHGLEQHLELGSQTAHRNPYRRR